MVSYSNSVTKECFSPSMLIDLMSRLLPFLGFMKKAPPLPVDILISRLSKLDLPKLLAMLSSDTS